MIGTMPGATLLLKGKGWTCLAALALPVVGIVIAVIGCSRLAKPNSWWARRLYRNEKLDRARQRYPKASEEPEAFLAPLAAVVLVVFAAMAVLYGIGIIGGGAA
jgi:hypothetical protein